MINKVNTNVYSQLFEYGFDMSPAEEKFAEFANWFYKTYKDQRNVEIRYLRYHSIPDYTYFITSNGRFFNVSDFSEVQQFEYDDGTIGIYLNNSTRIYDNNSGQYIPVDMTVDNLIAHNFCNPPEVEYFLKLIHIDGDIKNNDARNLKYSSKIPQEYLDA